MKRLLSFDYWNVPYDPKKPFKSFCNKVIRITLGVGNGFRQDELSLKASALTFYTLLSIIPVLAVIIGIAKGFGFEKFIEALLLANFYEQREITAKIIEFAHTLLQTTQGHVIVGVGILFLFWTILQLLSSIENSFNSIWKVTIPRTWARKVSDYFAMVIFCPIVIAASSSASIFITKVTKESPIWEALGLGSYLPILLHIFPLLLCWVLFSFIYLFMPNTKVPFTAGIIAGIIAGSVFQLVQWIYIKFQIGVSSYGAIYGSFAAIPLFLIWLNISWLLTLAGAEIAYHIDNDTKISAGTGPASERRLVSTKVLGLIIARLCVEAFSEGHTPVTITELTQKTGSTMVATQNIVLKLVEAGLLSEVVYAGHEGHYQPGRGLKHMTVKNICDALDEALNEEYLISDSKEVDFFKQCLESFDQLEADSPANVSLDSIKLTSGEEGHHGTILG
jgi:membrane protein